MRFMKKPQRLTDAERALLFHYCFEHGSLPEWAKNDEILSFAMICGKSKAWAAGAFKAAEDQGWLELKTIEERKVQ